MNLATYLRTRVGNKMFKHKNHARELFNYLFVLGNIIVILVYKCIIPKNIN